MKLKLLIFDQPILYAESLSQLLSQFNTLNDIQICSSYQDLTEILSCEKFDWLMFSSNIMKLSEINQSVKEIKKQHPDLKIIIIGNDFEENTIQELFNKGITAYLDKKSTLEEFINCVQKILQDDIFLYSHTKHKMDSLTSNKETSKPHTNKGKLTKRETEILKLICDGLSSKDISAKLFISINTVETHRKKILTKLKVKNSVGVVKYALENNIIV